MKRIQLTGLALAVALAALAETPGKERIDGLTLEQAIALAEQHHPELAEARALVAAAKARAGQAGRLSDPEAVARIESAPFNGRTAGSAEYVAGVSQAVPLGGRLSAARNVARLETDAASARSEVKRREVRSRVHGAFATALFFDAARQAFSNNLAGAHSLSRVTQARVEAGDAIREDLARAEMDEFQARVEMQAAESAQRLAIVELGAALGSSTVEIGSVNGSLDDALALPQIEAALLEIKTSPSVVAAGSEAAVQRARVQLAKARRIPDINFDLFYRRLQETSQNAFDAGIRIPIPLFSRSGRIREAAADAATAEARAASARLDAQQRLNRGLSDLNRALETARMIGRELVPRAQLVLTNAEARYKLGDASLADVLQKRRDWNATQVSYLQALREVHEGWRLVDASLGVDSRR